MARSRSILRAWCLRAVVGASRPNGQAERALVHQVGQVVDDVQRVERRTFVVRADDRARNDVGNSETKRVDDPTDGDLEYKIYFLLDISFKMKVKIQVYKDDGAR